MNPTAQRHAATSTKLELIHTQLGFDLLANLGDHASALLLRDGIYEAPETDLVTRIVRPGDTCIDAGCHIGYYSCLFGLLVGKKGRVYAFDANPCACHDTRRSLDLNGLNFVEVIQTALGDGSGEVQFYVSMDHQSGLSSVGRIPNHKEIILVCSQRLDTFLKDRSIGSVRLLKLNVEGAEEIVLRGLGPFLGSHAIEFILMECFDENLRLLNSSAEGVRGILKSAGYICWEYGTENPVGWSQTSAIRGIDGRNYLFSSPAVSEMVPSISLATALEWTRRELQSQRTQHLFDVTALRENTDKLSDDIDWLLNSINAYEQRTIRLTAESKELEMRKSELETVWRAVENSASWRILNGWRRVRNRLLPADSICGKMYHSLIGDSKGRK